MNLKEKAETLFQEESRDLTSEIEDTIVAIATPPGKGGIGIIRISGTKALSIGKKIFRSQKNSGKQEVDFQSHRIYFGKIIDPENALLIDEVILLPMMAPRSYTREDIVEIQAHSGRAVLDKILTIILKQEARIADHGEFTKRAFINGRIDLTQAEAVIDLINAETESERKIASGQLEGQLKNQLMDIQNNILKSLAEIEAQIEFAEDQGEEYIKKKFWKDHIYHPLKVLAKSAETGQLLKNGVRIALVGKPNVGKSSIMNKMLSQERSIVTPFPGTTRDHIEESIDVRGIKIRLMDTAGIHPSQNPIEIIGINKTREMIQYADLILMVCDLSGSIDEQDLEIYESIRNKNKIMVFNKKDLIQNQFFPQIPFSWEKENRIFISAIKNEGIIELKDLMVRHILESSSFDPADMVVSTIRQKHNIEKAFLAVQDAMACYEHDGPLEIVAMEFSEAKKQIDRAQGLEYSQDILDEVFKTFCIGK